MMPGIGVGAGVGVTITRASCSAGAGLGSRHCRARTGSSPHPVITGEAQLSSGNWANEAQHRSKWGKLALGAFRLPGKETPPRAYVGLHFVSHIETCRQPACRALLLFLLRQHGPLPFPPCWPVSRGHTHFSRVWAAFPLVSVPDVGVP